MKQEEKPIFVAASELLNTVEESECKTGAIVSKAKVNLMLKVSFLLKIQ